MLLLLLLLTVILAACSDQTEPKATDRQPEIKKEQKMKITIGQIVFTATLTDNETAQQFVELLPLTIKMNELNGNEKYANLSSSIREDRSNSPGTIQAGDIMCYSDNCLVLFYESFSTPYNYVPIGRIDDPDGLANALGTGNVEVTFEKN